MKFKLRLSLNEFSLKEAILGTVAAKQASSLDKSPA